MLSDEACGELAGMLIEFGCQLPDVLIPRMSKIRLRASDSLITASIKAGRDNYETFLKRFHYWLEKHSIGVEIPKEDMQFQDADDLIEK